jgi:hypothetical protein
MAKGVGQLRYDSQISPPGLAGARAPGDEPAQEMPVENRESGPPVSQDYEAAFRLVEAWWVNARLPRRCADHVAWKVDSLIADIARALTAVREQTTYVFPDYNP